MNQLVYYPLLFTTVTGLVILTANSARASLSTQKLGIVTNDSLVALEFTPPDDSAPKTSIGAGIRGDVEFSLPSGSSAPRSSVAGGSRGDVPRLTALVPPNKFGLTVSARPTIYVYLPPIGAQEVFFSIQDEGGNPHYHTRVQVPPDGGVISITLPSEAPALEIGKNYLWYFAPIEPGGILRPDNYAVIGWVKRIKLNLNEQELAAFPIKLATEYAKAGVWYDTLRVLVKAQIDAPNNKNYATEWHDLLKQVGLEAIASQSLSK
ncbi:DUF928 domain-containing protein [Aerosakkonemataceae cyanobacterium BLCC-F50]|uniref:DUF928 domain-containing protein n=1 Tax=Floridaenema flaviceps BLCC-F50 TaxID=3153642 RepID=A0ABV4XKH4_9CYAN